MSSRTTGASEPNAFRCISSTSRKAFSASGYLFWYAKSIARLLAALVVCWSCGPNLHPADSMIDETSASDGDIFP